MSENKIDAVRLDDITWLAKPDLFIAALCRIDDRLRTRLIKWITGNSENLTRAPEEEVAAAVAHILAPPLLVLWHDSDATEASFCKIVAVFVGWGYCEASITSYLGELRDNPNAKLLSICVTQTEAHLRHNNDDLDREHLVELLQKLIDAFGKESGLTDISSAKFEEYLGVLRNLDAHGVRHLRIYEHLSGMEKQWGRDHKRLGDAVASQAEKIGGVEKQMSATQEEAKHMALKLADCASQLTSLDASYHALEQRCLATDEQLRRTRQRLLLAIGIAVFGLLIALACLVPHFASK